MSEIQVKGLLNVQCRQLCPPEAQVKHAAKAGVVQYVWGSGQKFDKGVSKYV